MYRFADGGAVRRKVLKEIHIQSSVEKPKMGRNTVIGCTTIMKYRALLKSTGCRKFGTLISSTAPSVTLRFRCGLTADWKNG